jgi:hypothetical protein
MNLTRSFELIPSVPFDRNHVSLLKRGCQMPGRRNAKLGMCTLFQRQNIGRQFFSSYRGSGSLTENHEVNLTPFLIILQGKWSDPFTGYVLMNLIPYFGASEDRDTGTPGRTRFNFLRPLLRVSRKAQATTGR